jgi:hypothetical protein
MADIFVLELAYNNGTAPRSNLQANFDLNEVLSTMKGSSRLKIRVGYFGYCVRR